MAVSMGWLARAGGLAMARRSLSCAHDRDDHWASNGSIESWMALSVTEEVAAKGEDDRDERLGVESRMEHVAHEDVTFVVIVAQRVDSSSKLIDEDYEP